MTSKALRAFGHAIQDAIDLLNHFDALNTNPPPPQIEVLKRASLVMALAALEHILKTAYSKRQNPFPLGPIQDPYLADFYKESLENDLKYFHTPSTHRVRPIFKRYLGLDVTEGWAWNNCDSTMARKGLNKLAKKRGDIAHRSRTSIVKENPHPVRTQ